MKKLRLDLESVVVESFDTSSGTGARGGTVAGHQRESARGATCGQSCYEHNSNCGCDPDTLPGTWDGCYSGNYSCQGDWSGCECAVSLQQTNCPDATCRWTCGPGGVMTCGYAEC